MILADDFGLSPGINAAVLELVKLRSLDGFSCMVIPSSLDSLKSNWQIGEFASNAKIGLHFTLTNHKLFHYSSKPIDFYKLLMAELCKIIDQAGVKKELQLQLSYFREIFGRDPDFIDGHQFVHQLPTVATSICETLKMLTGENYFIRVYDQPTNLRLRNFIADPKSAGLAESKMIFGRHAKLKFNKYEFKTNRFLFDVAAGSQSIRAKDFYEKLEYYRADKDIIYFHPSAWPENLGVEHFTNRTSDYIFLKTTLHEWRRNRSEEAI